MNKIKDNIIPIALAGLVVINGFMFLRLYDMNRYLETLQYEVNNLDNNLNNAISQISSSVSQAIKKENSLVNSFNFEYGKMKDGLVDLNLTVSPKEISSNMSYFFSYDIDGEEELVEAKIKGTSEITAEIKIPIDKAIDVDFIESDRDNRKIEELNYIYAYSEKLLDPFRMERSVEGFSYNQTDKKLNLNKTGYNLTYFKDDYKEENLRGKTLEDVKIYVEVNGNLVDTFSMEKLDDSFPSYVDEYVFNFDKYSLNLKAKDTVEIYALASHSDGYKVKIILDLFGLDENGKLDHDMNFFGDEKSIIY